MPRAPTGSFPRLARPLPCDPPRCARRASPLQVAEYKAQFSVYDQDGSGEISHDELKQVWEAVRAGRDRRCTSPPLPREALARF